jgi:DNA-directed RNA polymerase subunit N (RpoN/RPB10)
LRQNGSHTKPIRSFRCGVPMANYLKNLELETTVIKEAASNFLDSLGNIRYLYSVKFSSKGMNLPLHLFWHAYLWLDYFKISSAQWHSTFTC